MLSTLLVYYNNIPTVRSIQFTRSVDSSGDVLISFIFWESALSVLSGAGYVLCCGFFIFYY